MDREAERKMEAIQGLRGETDRPYAQQEREARTNVTVDRYGGTAGQGPTPDSGSLGLGFNTAEQVRLAQIKAEHGARYANAAGTAAAILEAHPEFGMLIDALKTLGILR